MRWLEKLFQVILWSLIGIMGLDILYRGFLIAGETEFFQNKLFPRMAQGMERMAVEVFAPALLMDYGADETVPSISETEQNAEAEIKTAETEAEKETYSPETEAEEESGSPETEAEEESSSPETGAEEASAAVREPLAALPIDQMQDYHFLLNNYFTLDVSTATDESQINYETLTGRELSIQKDSSVPQILIYHTHSQEAFADSVEGEVSTTIVGVGARLKEILEEIYGYNVIHHTAVYDMVEGQLDRNKAYELAEADITRLLEENPTIEVIIDLHRDGVDGQKFVTEIDGKPTARIMFFNGLSRTALNGPVDYLPNPYIEDNLAFSFQLQLQAAQYFPGFTRNIYLQSLRYNLHFRPRSLLIEAGTQLNTVEEEYNAMEPLAYILNQVLHPAR